MTPGDTAALACTTRLCHFRLSSCGYMCIVLVHSSGSADSTSYFIGQCIIRLFPNTAMPYHTPRPSPHATFPFEIPSPGTGSLYYSSMSSHHLVQVVSTSAYGTGRQLKHMTYPMTIQCSDEHGIARQVEDGPSNDTRQKHCSVQALALPREGGLLEERGRR